MTDLFLLIVSTILLLVGLAITYWIHSHYELDITVQPAPPPEPSVASRISIIVPARNEDRNIRRCVEALLAQTYPNDEIIVVDDRSTDATAQILAEIQALHPNLGILHGEELPPGWAGKPHALAQGAAIAKGEWLCFVDADTFAGPDLLASTLAAAQVHRADLFTILTGQELCTFWEKTILPVVFTALWLPGRVNDPSMCSPTDIHPGPEGSFDATEGQRSHTVAH
jgi:chlorobactene glucosyltransferase